jgi:hypothetical protein
LATSSPFPSPHLTCSGLILGGISVCPLLLLLMLIAFPLIELGVLAYGSFIFWRNPPASGRVLLGATMPELSVRALSKERFPAEGVVGVALRDFTVGNTGKAQS